MKLELHKNILLPSDGDSDSRGRMTEKENFIGNQPPLLEDSWHLCSVTILLTLCSKGVFHMIFFSRDDQKGNLKNGV